MTPPDPRPDVVHELLCSRRSVRAYRPDPIARDEVLAVLRTASSAPSNSNTQPWRVHVLAGTPKRDLGAALEAAFRANRHPPSPHFPDPLPQEFDARQADFAARYYRTLGIDRADTAGRLRQTARNFSFFGAPVGLVFSIDARLARHSWLDLGLFVQSVMIAAKARGIDTCPQVAFARFHDVIASQLHMRPEEVTVCGMAMGYGDAGAGLNRMEMPRQPVEAFANLAGFDAP